MFYINTLGTGQNRRYFDFTFEMHFLEWKIWMWAKIYGVSWTVAEELEHFQMNELSHWCVNKITKICRDNFQMHPL